VRGARAAGGRGTVQGMRGWATGGIGNRERPARVPNSRKRERRGGALDGARHRCAGHARIDGTGSWGDSMRQQQREGTVAAPDWQN